jgi:predicted  nucleic acid-binding Zn-ribbon protein
MHTQVHTHIRTHTYRQLQHLQQELEFAKHEVNDLRRRARDGDARAVAAEKQLSGALKERQQQESLRAVAEAELRQERERYVLGVLGGRGGACV